jgi:hypothetical protein
MHLRAPLLLIGEHFVGLGGLFELLLALRVVTVDVRVEFRASLR